jgi:hypothetical protein
MASTSCLLTQLFFLRSQFRNVHLLLLQNTIATPRQKFVSAATTPSPQTSKMPFFRPSFVDGRFSFARRTGASFRSSRWEYRERLRRGRQIPSGSKSSITITIVFRHLRAEGSGRSRLIPTYRTITSGSSRRPSRGRSDLSRHLSDINYRIVRVSELSGEVNERTAVITGSLKWLPNRSRLKSPKAAQSKAARLWPFLSFPCFLLFPKTCSTRYAFILELPAVFLRIDY